VDLKVTAKSRDLCTSIEPVALEPAAHEAELVAGRSAAVPPDIVPNRNGAPSQPGVRHKEEEEVAPPPPSSMGLYYTWPTGHAGPT
jgi:hypothetical protein